MNTAPQNNLDWFTRAYIACALWSSNDNSTEQGGEPFDANYSPDDIAPETLARIAEDCAAFQADNESDLSLSGLASERAGHNFWLNRNGHGSGFWDEYNGKDAALRACFVRLSDASKAWGSFDLYLGDDGKIYGS